MSERVAIVCDGCLKDLPTSDVYRYSGKGGIERVGVGVHSYGYKVLPNGGHLCPECLTIVHRVIELGYVTLAEPKESNSEHIT